MKNTTWVNGQWNAICDVCGVKFKIGQLKKRWDGFLVCKDDWETRHPMDFIRLPDEKIGVIETRPQPDDVFVNPSLYCTFDGLMGIADQGTADCARADIVT